MSAAIVSGSALAAGIKADVKEKARVLEKSLGRPITLALVTQPADAAAQSYLKARLNACQGAGIAAKTFSLTPDWDTARLLRLLGEINCDAAIDALIVDFPLPLALDAQKIRAAILPEKDAEGLSPERFGRLFLAKTYEDAQALVTPPTAKACAELLRQTGTALEGRRALVIGRSPIVGRPAAQLLSLLGLTVTIAHSRTRDLESEVKRADVLIAAAGKARLVQGGWIKPGAAVIDAGVNQDKNSLCGDVDFAAASRSASFITPVPGGVGPVTTACLLANVLLLAQARTGLARANAGI